MALRTKLALWYSGLLTVVIIIFSMAVIMVSRVTILNTVDRWLDNLAETVARQIEIRAEANGDAEAGVVAFHSDNILHTPGIWFQIWQIADVHTGEQHPPVPLYDTDVPLVESAPIDSHNVSVTTTTFSYITINNIPERVVIRPLYTDDEVLFGIVQISTPIQFLSHSNDQLIVVTVVSAAICIIVSILLSSWLSTHLLKPVNVITDAALSVANAEDLSTRLEWQGPQDELGKLIEVFNDMMERLERLFKVQQRFVSDISHELRTPLTAIIGNLELMDLYGVEKTSLDAMQREAQRMHRMVKDLLWLIRADYGEHEMNFHKISLDNIALSVYEVMLGRTQNRQLTIVMERVDSVEMVACGEEIRLALTNILHNAIKFTDDGGKVSLSIYAENDQAIIDVRDTGIGISKAEQEHIFDRFYQADTSRLHRDETDGAGLGLSIVQWIVQAHHGTIEVESVVGQGSLFRVCLPLKASITPIPENDMDSTDIAALKVKRQSKPRPKRDYVSKD